MINGKRLRGLRKQIRITADELGGILGVSGQQVLRYETQRNDMPTAMLIRIADFFDVSADYLLGRADIAAPYERRKQPANWSIDASAMLKAFQPEFIARLLRSTGINVRLSPERIKVSDMLKEHPPEKVAAFINALNPSFKVVMDTDIPGDETDEP